jgi:hypothetical protein
MTTFAASVTIVDLPAGTTVSGAELFEAVQTTAGVGQSVQLSLSQMLTVAALPKINTLVTVGNSLMTTGNATAIAVALATAVTATGTISAINGLALVTGGTAAVLVSSVASFGIFVGTGVPSVSAGTGSIYMRSDATTATSRMYVNNSGTGVWTAVNTVA